MEVIEFIRGEVQEAHSMLEGVLVDLNDENVHWQPPGTANTIAALLAHVVSGQDLAINRALRGGDPLYETAGWAAKTGIPLDRREIWGSKSWRLNVDALREYRIEVQRSADAYFASITPADLDRDVIWGPGPRNAWWVVRNVIINHMLLHSGEVSTLKGLQGLKGLPM